MSLRPSWLAALLLAAACQPSTGPSYESDVAPILAARCTGCHQDGAIAPFSLTTYAEAKEHAQALVAAVESGQMPPWRAAAADVAYLRNPSLTEDEKAALRAWAEGGTPEKSAAPLRTLSALSGGIERVDLTLQMAEPYTPTKTPDDYRCFVLNWPEADDAFLTGFNALPGTPKQVHHIAVYLIPPESAALPAQWDEEEEGPGYTCYGGPFGKRPQTFAVNLLGSWIPGSSGVALPRNVGIGVPKGSTVVLQLHYNLASGAAEPDQTSLQFQLQRGERTRAAYQPLLNPGWPLGGMPIPPLSSKVNHQYQADPRAFFSVLGSPLKLDAGFNLEAVMFHMHKLGVHGALWQHKADGTKKLLLDIPRWDFHWQLEYYFESPQRFEPGDQLSVQCQFDNPTMRDVNWGEGSDDEMCVANLLSSEL